MPDQEMSPQGTQPSRKLKDLTVVIDGVIFQMKKGKAGGISNVWKLLLDSISKKTPFKKVILLDRGHSPKFDSIESLPFSEFSPDKYDEDCNRIDDLCARTGADLFISTYFTSPKKHYAIAYLHDFIPEKMGMNLNQPTWLIKMWTIDRARGYIGVSNTTLEDLRALHPAYHSKPRSLVYNSIADDFRQYSPGEIASVRAKYGIKKKYFLLLGERMNYKNAVVFFKAFAQLKNKDEFQIVAIGGFERIEYFLRFYVLPFKDFVTARTDDAELSMLMNQAEALVYPSLYEGFGMPILESMSSGCPVIIADQATACKEVASDAALIVDGHRVESWTEALQKVQLPEVRNPLITQGKKNIERFTHHKMTQQFYDAIAQNISEIKKFQETRA